MYSTTGNSPLSDPTYITIAWVQTTNVIG